MLSNCVLMLKKALLCSISLIRCIGWSGGLSHAILSRVVEATTGTTVSAVKTAAVSHQGTFQIRATLRPETWTIILKPRGQPPAKAVSFRMLQRSQAPRTSSPSLHGQQRRRLPCSPESRRFYTRRSWSWTRSAQTCSKSSWWKTLTLWTRHLTRISLARPATTRIDPTKSSTSASTSGTR